MRARFVPVAAVVASLSCSGGPAPGGPVAVAPNIVVPEDLIGQIAKFDLQIWSTKDGIGCNATTGQTTGDVMKATPVASTGNISTMCPAGVLRCAQLTKVPYQTSPSVFSVTGFGADGKTAVAVGCAQATINQAALDVNIKLVRVLPKAVCGDGAIEPTETCDDASAACSPRTKCQTVEELLSYGDTANAGTSTGSVGQKTNPFFLWSSSSGSAGSDAAGALIAVFTDSSFSSSTTKQIGVRLMDDALSPPTLFGVTADTSSIFLPNCTSGCSTLPPPPASNDEKDPSAASLGGNAYVVFSSDAPQANGDAFDIYYEGFAQSSSLTAISNPCPVNTPTNSASKTNTAPSVAANGSSLFVAWQDNGGNVSGRVITPGGGGCGTQGTETDNFGSGLGGSTTGPKVAPAGSGWAVVWPQGTSIELQLFDSSGNPSGNAKTVGTGANPSVASDGKELAVAWAGANGVQVQRYTASGSIPGYASGDAKAAKVNTTGDLASAPTPAIAGGLTPSSNGFFAVAWLTSSGVAARLVNGGSGSLADNSGYLFNTVDGTANDFQVNVNSGRSPANPTVAVGGNGGSYIAFGWEDHGSSCPSPSTFPGAPCFGVVARRFPVPTN